MAEWRAPKPCKATPPKPRRPIRISSRCEGAADATINRVTAVVRAAYKRAKTAPPTFLHLSEKDNVRKGFFSVAESRSVLSYLPNDGLSDFVLFAYLCGWRKGSIASLRWVDVDLEEGEINLPGEFAKNAEPLKMPIEDELKELMLRRKEARAIKTKTGTVISSFVFHRNGRPVGEFQKVMGHGDRSGQVSR